MRYELLAQLQLRTGGDVAILDVRNVSSGGVLIGLSAHEHPDVREDEEVRVFMDIGDDTNGQPIDLDTVARVVRVDLGGVNRPASIALQWTSEDPAFMVSLSRLIARVRELAGELVSSRARCASTVGDPATTPSALQLSA